MTKVRQSAQNIYDPDIVPLSLRPLVIEIYTAALRGVFIWTTGVVVLNLFAGMRLREYVLHDKIGGGEGGEGDTRGVHEAAAAAGEA